MLERDSQNVSVGTKEAALVRREIGYQRRLRPESWENSRENYPQANVASHSSNLEVSIIIDLFILERDRHTQVQLIMMKCQANQ